MIRFNCKFVSFFFKSLNNPREHFVKGRRLNLTLGSYHKKVSGRLYSLILCGKIFPRSELENVQGFLNLDFMNYSSQNTV